MDRAALIQEIDDRNAYAYEMVYKLEKASAEMSSYIEETLDMIKLVEYKDAEYQGIIMLAANLMGIGAYVQAYELFEGIDRQRLVSESTDFIRMIYYSNYMIYYSEHIGNDERALEYAEKELEAAELYGDQSEVMRARMNLASIVGDNGLWDTAVDMYMGIIQYCESVKEAQLLSYCYINLGRLYRLKGSLDEAIVAFNQAIVNAKKTGLSNIEQGAYIALSKVYTDQEDYEKALDYLKPFNFKDNEERTGDTIESIDRALALAQVYKLTGRLEAAFQELQWLEAKIESLENDSVKIEFYQDKAEICELMDRSDLAYTALKAYVSLADKQNNEKLQMTLNKFVHEAYNKEMNMLNTLASVGRELTTFSDVDEMLLKLKDEFSAILPADSIGIGLVEGDELHFEHYFNNGQKIEPKSTNIDSPSSLAAWSTRNREALIINHLKEEYTTYVSKINLLAETKGQQIQSLMFRPLIVGDEIIGVFTVQSYKENAYSSIESKIHKIITDYLAIAVSNAKQKESLRKLTVRDNLTNLYNRRGFTEFYERRVILPNKVVDSVAIIMLDLDYFKRINDTYGHQTGDDVLCMVAQVIQGKEEPDIIAARLGGEEFALVVINKSKDEVITLAEAIRSGIETMSLRLNGQEVQITTSVGVVYNQANKTANFNQLYFEADKALYKAKGEGRNRVLVKEG